MSSSHPERTPGARLLRPFVVVDYDQAGGSGCRVPELPDRCPRSVAEGLSGACSIRRGHLRLRETAPGHPVLMARCKAHGAFTLYPPGSSPYRRKPAVLAERAASGPIADPFDGTTFEAALSAARGEAWARDSTRGVPERWWSAQCRHLRTGARILGLGRDTSDDLRARIGSVLRVAALRLKRLCGGAWGYRAMGRAICEVLLSAQRTTRFAFDLLVCAHLAGDTGPPMTFSARRGFTVSPFHAAGTTCRGSGSWPRRSRTTWGRGRSDSGAVASAP